MSGLPPGLDEFGWRLRQAAAEEAGPVRSSGKRRAIVLSIVAALGAGGVTAAATRVLDNGPAISPETRGRFLPPKDPQVLAATLQRDPTNGDPWVLKAFSDTAGKDCVVAGQLRRGVFGLTQRGRFRALPRQFPGVCGDVAADGVLLYVQQYATVNRVAIFGMTASRQPVTITVANRTFRRTPKSFGAFLLVLADSAERPVRATVSASVDGKRVEVQR